MFTDRFKELEDVTRACIYTTASKTIDETEAFEAFRFLLQQNQKVEGMVYVIGNGGSAGIASHFCTDLLRTLELSAAVPSDFGVLTCFANDFGYENVYAMPLEKNMRNGDLLVAISSSGASENIIRGVKVARTKKCPVITLTGFDQNNPLKEMGDLNFWLDSDDYGLVEMGHFFLLHTVIDLCKRKSQVLETSKRS